MTHDDPVAIGTKSVYFYWIAAQPRGPRVRSFGKRGLHRLGESVPLLGAGLSDERVPVRWLLNNGLGDAHRFRSGGTARDLH
jgi:hypothetical protein